MQRSVCRRMSVRSGRARAQSQDDLKRQSAVKAVEYVQSGMRIGLGTGSTAAFAVERVGELVQSGELRDIIAVPTSVKTQQQAQQLGIPLASLDDVDELDVAIDGADEVDGNLELVKGRGGALLREKMVELNAKTFVVIVDESKQVSQLGASKDAMPVEVVPFCWQFNQRKIEQLPEVAGCTAKRRMQDSNEPYITDNGNYIIDLYFDGKYIEDPHAASRALSSIVGVVEHGLFLGMTDVCINAKADGVQVHEKKAA